jgi:galactitol-specific phosphotransferase system IIB component
MTDLDERKQVAECAEGKAHSTMEKTLLEEYLNSQGYSLSDLKNLPVEQAKALMAEACKYASLKLSQIESRAGFRDKIRGPS